MKTLQANAGQNATPHAMRAQEALARGDTAKASELFREAGDILKIAAKQTRDAAERNELLFLAASQYYHGGHYREAKRLCGKIQPRLLSGRYKPIFDKFVADVAEHSDPEYRGRIRAALADAKQRGDFDGILQLLKNHPFVAPAGLTACVRALCCEAKRDFRAMAFFLADSIRFGGVPFVDLSFFAAGTLVAMDQSRPDDVLVYAGHLREFIPDPMVSLAASIVHFQLAMQAAVPANREKLIDEQLQLFGAVFPDGPRATPSDDEGRRSLQAIAMQAAALSYVHRRQFDLARQFADLAVEFAPPDLPGSSKVRELVYGADENSTEPALGLFRDQEASLRQRVGAIRGSLQTAA